MLSYLYKKYLDWSDYYRNREPNQYPKGCVGLPTNTYGTTLYPRTLDDLPAPYSKGCSHSAKSGMSETYPAVVAVAAEPQSEATIDLRRKTYKEALVNNLKKI